MHPPTVFLVEHLRDQGDSNDIKLIGIYSTREQADAAVKRKQIFPGFSDFPRVIDTMKDEETSGFYISEITLDQDYWSEGFIYEPNKA